MKIEFNLAGYRTLLKSLLDGGFSFQPFQKNVGPTNRTCLLRHDVDIDLGYALEMARIEAELGVRATYFLMLRSPVYNLFSRENFRLAQELLSLGHFLGLHYDEGFDSRMKGDTKADIDFECGILEVAFNKIISAVSFHQPGSRVLNGEITLGNRLNTYNKTEMPNFVYLSDSNMKFHSDPITLATSGEFYGIHLLIHPIWWMHSTQKNTNEIWTEALIRAFHRCQRQILATERAYGGTRQIFLNELD